MDVQPMTLSQYMWEGRGRFDAARLMSLAAQPDLSATSKLMSQERTGCREERPCPPVKLILTCSSLSLVSVLWEYKGREQGGFLRVGLCGGT